MIIVPVEKRIDWKRPPIVLIALVVINLLVFALYQSGDNKLINQAIVLYDTQGLLEVELPAYRAYLRKTDPDFKIDESDPFLVAYIVSDPGFGRFIEAHQKRYVSVSKRSQWRKARTKIQTITAKISSNALGLNPVDMTPLTLISHQFLHGGIDHLLGNLVFLILTGFAVEAALGSRRFLAYYLVSGVGGGLLFGFFQTASGGATNYLVGASGAISGVMAMYVVLFGLRKIEFFYWLFVFTGYFRAVAILMLPAYIVKELAMMVFTEGTNVAYTAHIGGFAVGAALVAMTRSMHRAAIDDDYLDGVHEQADPYHEALQQLYNEIAQCEFKKAWHLLQPLKGTRPNDPELIEIDFNLINALNAAKLDGYLLKRLGKRANSRKIIAAQLESWGHMSPETQAALTFEHKSALLENALELGRSELSENIYALLERQSDNVAEIAITARKLASYFRSIGHKSKTKKYDQLAKHYTQSSIDNEGSMA